MILHKTMLSYYLDLCWIFKYGDMLKLIYLCEQNPKQEGMIMIWLLYIIILKSHIFLCGVIAKFQFLKVFLAYAVAVNNDVFFW